MYIQQRAPAAFPLSLRLQAVFVTLARAMKGIGTDSNAGRADAHVPRLEPHLRYDIGEIDCDPRRTRSFGQREFV
jgi:hypothetical protein